MQTVNTAIDGTQKTMQFDNLKNAIKAEREAQLSKSIEGLNEFTTVAEILDKWQYRELLPKGNKKVFTDVEVLKAYLIGRMQKSADKYIQDKFTRLDYIVNSGELQSVTISIEWKKSRMWGSNPRANGEVHYLDAEGRNRYESFDSGSIGGCGYDKESTAVANICTQINPLLKSLYTIKETNPTGENREIFGYGAGYGILPSIEGGVGCSCYPAIFEKLGYKFQRTASGKTFDVYQITKL